VVHPPGASDKLSAARRRERSAFPQWFNLFEVQRMQILQHGIILSLIIGGVAGWLAGLIMNGAGFGVLVDILVGIVGGVVGGWLFGLIGLSFGGGIFGTLLTAVIGAVVLIFIIRLIRRG
jgi:uncharacterized membrane protein YeaQ/YmgE (transglycosylase-associated protein family)